MSSAETVFEDQQVTSPKRLGVMGGTFDPIHIGHLCSAIEVKDVFKLDEMRLLPCHIPSHRDQPDVSADQRLEMINHALLGQEDLVVDDRELKRESVSYSYDTLVELREEVGQKTQLFFVVGMDAFALFHTWYRWREILSHTHLIVLSRPGSALESELPSELEELLDSACVPSIESIADKPAGNIIIVELTQLEVSATEIRERVSLGKSVRYLVPDSVAIYIEDNRLYSDDSSS